MVQQNKEKCMQKLMSRNMILCAGEINLMSERILYTVRHSPEKVMSDG